MNRQELKRKIFESFEKELSDLQNFVASMTNQIIQEVSDFSEKYGISADDLEISLPFSGKNETDKFKALKLSAKTEKAVPKSDSSAIKPKPTFLSVAQTIPLILTAVKTLGDGGKTFTNADIASTMPKNVNPKLVSILMSQVLGLFRSLIPGTRRLEYKITGEISYALPVEKKTQKEKSATNIHKDSKTVAGVIRDIFDKADNGTAYTLNFLKKKLRSEGFSKKVVGGNAASSAVHILLKNGVIVRVGKAEYRKK